MTNLVTTDAAQNGTGAPLLDDLVERYLTFAKKSAENIIKLAETLVEAKAALHELELRDFCKMVGLEFGGSTYRKLLKIGQEASRFEPFFQRMPNSWTTVYKLATLEKDKFDHVARDERFAPTMTASEVDLIISGEPPGDPERLPIDCRIHLDGFDKSKKLEVCGKLTKLADEYGFRFEFSSHIEKELVPTTRPSLAQFLRDKAA